MKAILLAICATLACVAAGPVRPMSEPTDSCAMTCRPGNKFRYTPGQTYVYQYSVQTNTGVTGASEERATMVINGQANIEVIDQCEMVLQFERVNVMVTSTSDELVDRFKSQKLNLVLQRYPLRFSFQDGVVEGLCPQPDEDPWALNIKRGVLSALQNSMDFHQERAQTVRESDVTGQCDTHYEVKDSGYWGGSTNIRRQKDLMSCSDRQGFQGSLHTARFHMEPLGMQSLPLLQSDHDCEQVISEGLVQSSVCKEKHLFRPFSAQQGGVQTEVDQSLTLVNTRRGVQSRKDWIVSRAEMTFDHGYGIKDSSEARVRAETLLNKLCRMTIKGVQPDVPRTFSQLVGAVKKLDSSDIRQVYRQLKNEAICRDNNERTKKFFLDALPMAASNEAVDMMKELMISGDVTGLQVDLYLASMAFISEPTALMIDSVKELLSNDKLKMQAMLAVSSMVHSHCKKVGCSSRSVDAIMSILDDAIGYRCAVNDGNIKTVLTTLSAIGNTGHPKAPAILSRCLGDRAPLEVRVAAAQAYRRLSCDADRRPLEELMRDRNEDNEVRIMTYLQLMTCPSTQLLDILQIILEDEPEDSQVGSFIHSHLSNLKETSSPLKQDLKKMLEDLQLSKEFNMNPLKSSRNYEKSSFLKLINSGVQAESNVIFSPQSPVPRSVSANLTVDVLGHSVNLLEIGARLEGVEYLIESLQGHFFGDGKNAPKNKLDELKGSGYTRIFGNELLYNRFQGLQSLTSGKTFNLLDFLIKLSKDHDYSFTQSLQFLDTTMTTPTVAGLPLTLSVNGSATVDVKATGKMDLRKVSKSPRTLHVEGEIRPSGAVDVDGLMMVDGLVTGVGLKVSSSLTSSMALKGRVELDRGRTLNLQVDVPDDRMDLVDIRTKFFIVHDKVESEQKMITDNRREHELCTGDFLSSMTGLELCGQLQFPNASMQSEGPYFPLTGPSSFSLVLHKRDSHSGYKLLAKRVENKRSSIAQLSFDTPGSSVVRAVSFDMMIDYPQKEAEISFASPWKKTSVKGSLVSEAGLKSVTGSVVIDDDQTYSLTTELKVDEQNKDGLAVFTPNLLLRRPGADDVTLMGDVKVDQRLKHLSADLTLNGATKRPLQLQGSYTNTQSEKSVSGSVRHGRQVWSANGGVSYSLRRGKSAEFRPQVTVSTPQGEVLRLDGQTEWRNGRALKSDHTLTAPGLLDTPVNLKCDIIKKNRRKGPRYDVDVRLKSRPFTGKVSGVIVLADSAFTNLKVDYNANRLGRDRITITGKLSNRSTGAFKKYIVSSTVEFKRHPDWNVDTTLDLEHKKKRSGGSLTLVLGKDRKDDSKKVSLAASMVRNIKSLSDADVNYKMKAVVPMMDVDYSLNGVHSHSPSSLSSEMTFRYSKDQAVKAEVNLKGNLEKQKMLNGDARLSLPGGRQWEVDSGLKKKGKQMVHTLNMKTHKGPLLTMSSTYKPSKHDTHEINTNLNIDGFDPIKISGMVGTEWDKLQLQGQAVSGQNSYSLNALSKISKGPQGKWLLDLRYPSRSLGMSLSGGLQKNSADLDVDLAWDKERDKSAKVSLSMSGTHKNTRAITSSSGKMDLNTPWSDKLSVALSLDNNQKRYGLDGRFTLGPKSNSYFTTLNVLKPVTPDNLQLTCSLGTPLRGWKRQELSVDHRAIDRTVDTTLKATRGKEEMQVKLAARDNSLGDRRDLTADVSMTSDIRGLEELSLALAHKDDGRKYENSAVWTRNKDRYSADLDMTHSYNGWQMENSGSLNLRSPSQTIGSTWQHVHSDHHVLSTLTSTWDRGQKLQVTLSGNKTLTDRIKIVNSALTIQSPWRRVRDLSLTLSHNMRDGSCSHRSSLVHNGEKKASAELDFRPDVKKLSGSFSLNAPLLEKKSGRVNVEYMTYPVTIHSELLMGPGKNIMVDASMSKSGDLDTEGNLRVVTPFRAVRTITLSGSTSSHGEDVIAKANLDYGIRQNYDVTLTLRPQTLALGRLAVRTPHRQFSSLDAGYQLSGDLNDLSAAADFSLEPWLDKYSASLGWQLDDELSSKIRINTPMKDLRYMQMTATSKTSDQGRTSRVEVEYYPRQVYALSSLYSTEMPIVFSLSAETPIQGYDSFGLRLRHQHDDTSISTHGELRYLPDKVIDSTLTLNWQRNVAGSLVVKTPFPDFEESKLSVRHDGELDNFKSHAEMEIMHESMVADAHFKYGYTTTGSFTLESSMKDMDKIEAAFKKTGPSDNFRSSASVAFGDKKMEGTLNHKLNPRALKTAVTFNSPFTKMAKSSVDLSNRQGNMQALISGQYGRRKVDSSSSLTIDDSDFTASSSITYNLDGRSDQQMQATASKKGDRNNLQIRATFSTPFTPDVSTSLQHASAMPYSLKTTLSVTAGEEYSFITDNSFSHRDPMFSASSVNNYRFGGPLKEASLTVRKSGDIKNLSVAAVAKLDQKEVSVEGEMRTVDGFSGSLLANTPFPDYEHVGMSLSYLPNNKGFKQEGRLSYKTDKTIQNSVIFVHTALEHLQLDATLDTPFPDLEKNSLSLRHDYNKIRKQCNGKIEIQSKKFRNRLLTYQRQGNMDEMMTMQAEYEIDGEKKMEGHMEWVPLSHGFKRTVKLQAGREVLTVITEFQMTDESISLKTSTSLPPTTLSFEAEGAVSGFNVDVSGKLSASHDSNSKKRLLLTTNFKRSGSPKDFDIEMDLGKDSEKITITGSFKNTGGETTGKMKIKTPFPKCEELDASFKHSGDLNRFNSEGSIGVDDKKVSGKATFYRYQWKRLEATAELRTPIRDLEFTKVEYRHEGGADSFSCSSSLEYGDGEKISSDLRGTLSPKYDITFMLKTPFKELESMVAEAKMENLANTRSISGSVNLGQGQRYAAEGSLEVEEYSMSFNSKLTTPLEQLPSVQLSGSYQGQLDDLSSSLVFVSPSTDVIKYDSMLKYKSLLDVNAAMSLSSQLPGMEDLRMEVKNTDVDNSKTGHMLIRWAPNKQMSLDGSYVLKDLWYNNREVQADLSLTTPFHQLRSANLHVQHEEKDKSYAPKVDLTVNGESLLDAEGELNLGDNPSASLLTRSPRPTQVTASITRDGHEVLSDLFINWDRDQNDQHVRLQTKAKDIRDDYQTNLDYSLKVVHPSRTVSTGVMVLSKDQKVSSEGYVSLDDRADRKLFYTLAYSDNSHYYGKAHDGTLRFGVPGRTLEASGSYSQARQTSALDASFSWDADRDPSKQMGLNAKVVKGDKTKADLTLRLPTISKEVQVEHEMAVSQGRTLWEGRTSLSYTPDASKTLTLISSLKDISDSYSSGKNYSLALSVSHPHTNTDISFTSHVGAVGDRLSAAMDTVYLTSRHTRKNMVLRGEIDRLRRQIDLQLDSPMKKLTVHGEVKASEPYILELTNTYDEEDVIRSQVQIDTQQRSLKFSTNYDLDNPANQMVVKVGYVNASAISAQLLMQGPSGRDDQRSEGSAILRLDSPTLLHAGLFWRPQALKDLQDYIQRKTITYSDEARQAMSQALEATGQEVSDKYAAIAEELRSEFSPMLDLAEGELYQLGQQMDRASRVLTRMYRRNDLHLQDLGDYVLDIIRLMKEYSNSYKEAYMEVLTEMRSLLSDVTNFNVRQHYDALVDQLGQQFKLSLARTMDSLVQLLSAMQEESELLWANGHDQWQQLKNHPQVQHLHKRVQRLGQDYRWLMSYMGKNVADIKLPERYTSAIYQVHDQMAEGLNGLSQNQHVQKMQEVANQAYQQGVWAYNYWNVEENMQKALHNLTRLLGDLLRQELEQMTQQAQFFRLSRLTVYDPEHGRMEADLVLPIRLKNLQEMPDLSAYVQEVEDLVESYLPDREALVEAYQKYAPWANNSSSPDEDIMSQFEAYTPSARWRRMNARNRRVRGM